MTVHDFIRSREPQWHELRDFLERTRGLSLARLPLDDFRRGSRLYRQVVADLAYARMCYADHPAVGQLEQLAGMAHSLLYQAGKARSRNWWEFWRVTWPAVMRQTAGPIFLAAAIFWVGAALGYALAARNPVLENYFVSPGMRQAINSGKLWTESLTRVAPAASSQIATNNIQVSLLTWGLGITFGVGTAWFLLFNGLMLGAIAAACLRAGMLVALGEFVVGHGCLELPVIWIAGGAGLLLADALLLPGKYRRGDELRLKARRSAQIMVGIVPILLVAGVIEAFVSPSELPGIAKASLGLAFLIALIAYVVAAPRPAVEVDHLGSDRQT